MASAKTRSRNVIPSQTNTMWMCGPNVVNNLCFDNFDILTPTFAVTRLKSDI